MDTFNLEAFIKKNNELSVKSLLSFLEVEVKDNYFKEIEYFLNNSKIGDEKELTDHFIVKVNPLEVLIYNETVERFAQNPCEYRFVINIAQLLFLISQKMSYGNDRMKSYFGN